MLAALILSISLFLLVYLQALSAGVLLHLTSISLAYLGAAYMVTTERPNPLRDKSLAFAFCLTSIGLMAYAIRDVGEISSDGKLQTQLYHIFVVPLLIGVFFAGRFLHTRVIGLTNFVQHTVAATFCLYIALKDEFMSWQGWFLVVAIFAWLSIQTFFGRHKRL